MVRQCIFVSQCVGTHLQLCVDALGQLLSIGFQEFGGGLEGLEVLLAVDLPVSYGHEVSHDVYQACIITICHLVTEAPCPVFHKGC